MIKSIVEGRVLTTKEAKMLLQFDWFSEFADSPESIQNEAEGIYYSIYGSIEEVEEGYVEDTTDDELLESLNGFYKKIVRLKQSKFNSELQESS